MSFIRFATNFRRLIGSTPGDVAVALTFGGPAVDYAGLVHEDLDAIHPVGQAKFLESTLMESRPFLAARIGKRIDMGKGDVLGQGAAALFAVGQVEMTEAKRRTPVRDGPLRASGTVHPPERGLVR